jgi:hypothetical protein
MIVGSVLRDFYIAQWRQIPALVAAMANGDEGMIRTSAGVPKLAKSLQREVLEMPEGSIFVAYQGFTRGQARRSEVTSHQVAAFIRAVTPDDDANIPFGDLMIDGIPDGQQPGQELPVRYLTPHIDADPMDMPKFERVSASELTIDIWKLSFSIPEHFA